MMNRFGYRIRNHGSSEVLLHRCGGRRIPIPAHGAIECPFPGWYGLEDAFEQLEDTVLQLAISLCARTAHFEFDIQATEFGYRLTSLKHGIYDVELLDDDPHRFYFANGEALTTEGPVAANGRRAGF